MGIDIELDGEILTLLDIELLDTVLSEKTEHTTTGILTRYLDDIFLRHPIVTCASRNAALCCHNGNDSSC